MANDEANAIKDVARELNDLGDVVDEVANLRKSVDSLTSELKEVRRFKELRDALDTTNKHLATIADELRRIREKA